MSNTEIGYLPTTGQVRLIDGQDFYHEFVASSALAGGATVSLEILDRDKTYTYGIWASTGSGTSWPIRIDAADHADIPNGAWFRLWVLYPSDGGRVCWIAGTVKRNLR